MIRDEATRALAGALGRVPSGIFILTLARPGVETGMLASWVQQCAFEPPLVSFAIQRGRPVADLLARGTALTINILEASQTDMIAHFGKGFALEDDAFEGIDVRREPGQGPVLTESLAYLHCQVRDRFPAGDHELFVAQVMAGAVLDEGQPLVHVRKNGLHY